MLRYDPAKLEPAIRELWQKADIYKTLEDSKKPKRYVLEYFPYPSGAAMHVGHVRNYTIGDAVARFYRMHGFNVLHPMGWDAFGLPAENYAIANSISPQEAIAKNTAKFKKQLTQMGFSYDWSREVNSSDPAYYKWTQWFFKLLYEKGLAYQKESLQWWCETDQTVLANEQVENGKCWRCGNAVTKKPLKQWFFKITDYADRLAEDLEDLDWSEGIKSMQRNWIGKSTGAEIDFAIKNSKEKIKVFTTRADTLFGATFMVLAPEHPLVSKITTEKNKTKVEEYVTRAQRRSDIERMETERPKTGVFTGVYAINPINKEQIPIWVADYILMDYGTGAIMAVPAHDERDFAFAKKFNLPIKQVIAPIMVDNVNPPKEDKKNTTRNVAMCVIQHPAEGKFLTLKWKKQPWHNFVTGGIEKGEDLIECAKREITEETGYRNIELIRQLPIIINSHFYAAHKDVNRDVMMNILEFKLTDLKQQAVKRGKHEDFNVVWSNRKEIENLKPLVELPYILRWLNEGDYAYSGEGKVINSGKFSGLDSNEMRDEVTAELKNKKNGKEKVNYKLRDWLISRQRYWGAPIPLIHCPKCGIVPVPDKDLPVELPKVGNYKPTKGKPSVLAEVENWVNVKCPVCGETAKRETDTMDGFACSSWYFLRFADPHNNKIPFSKDKASFWLPVDDYIGGAEHAVMHLLYARFWTKVIKDEGLIDFNEPFLVLRNQGMILASDGRKMSKSWNNTIAPDELIEQGYGADAIRLMELFIGPWDQDAAWSVEGLGGCFRFLQRVWVIIQKFDGSSETKKDNTAQAELLRITHKAIKNVTADVKEMGFNTAIAALMEFTNKLYKLEAKHGFKAKDAWQFALENLILLLAPFAPHITESLWQQIGKDFSVHQQTWPKHDEAYLVQDNAKIAIQVNGKVRGTIEVPADSEQSAVEEAAKLHENASQYLKGKIKKIIYIPNKLISFVV